MSALFDACPGELAKELLTLALPWCGDNEGSVIFPENVAIAWLRLSELQRVM